MTDNLARHLVAALATAITALAFYAGYISGGYGWWWAVFAVFIVYGAVYKIIDAD